MFPLFPVPAIAELKVTRNKAGNQNETKEIKLQEETTIRNRNLSFQNAPPPCHKTWKCQTCRVFKSRGGAAVKQDSHADIAGMLVGMSKKLDALLAMKDTVDNIEQSIQLMSDKYDYVLRRREELGN